MPGTVGGQMLSRRALGRATLARQHLLKRSAMPALDFVAHAYGLQAQAPMAPYYALWARLDKFVPQALSDVISDRRAVRIVVMRGTVHLLAAEDARMLRPLLQPLMDRDITANIHGAGHLSDTDLDRLAEIGRGLVEESPMTMAELRPVLAEHFPGDDPEFLARALRDLLPLLQVPPRGLWGKAGQPALTTIESWLGPQEVAPTLDGMVRRYLAAYGPASVADIQAWCGMTRLGEIVDRLRPTLRTFVSESGTQLFDLPDAPRPDPATPAPVRILAPFDNVLLSYADRTRIMDDEYKSAIFTVNGIIKPAVLVNGRVVGWCASTAKKSDADLEVHLLEKVAKTHRAAIEREGAKLLAFAHPSATPTVRLLDPV